MPDRPWYCEGCCYSPEECTSTIHHLCQEDAEAEEYDDLDEEDEDIDSSFD